MKTNLKTLFQAAGMAIAFCGSLNAEPVAKFMPSVPVASNALNAAVSVCGDTVLVGGGSGWMSMGDLLWPGCAFVYSLQATGWVEQARLASPVTTNNGGYYGTNSGRFGAAVALGTDYAVVGAPDEFSQAGRAYVFHRLGTNWSLAATLQPDKQVPEPLLLPWFGTAVAADGEVIAVGAPMDNYTLPPGGGELKGAVYVYRRSGGVWAREAKLSGPAADPDNAGFGNSVALRGDLLAVGGLYQLPSSEVRQAVYLYRFDAGNWTLLTRLNPSEYCGSSGSVDLTTETVVLGARSGTNAAGVKAGTAYVFTKLAGGWASAPTQTETAKLTSPDGTTDDYFGISVAVDGDVVCVGESRRDFGSGFSNVGRVCVFLRTGGVWSLFSRLRMPDGEAHDNFGDGLALRSGRLAVAAPGANYYSDNVGAVYLLRPLSPAPPYGPSPTDWTSWMWPSLWDPSMPLSWTNGEATTTIDLYLNTASYITNQVITDLVLSNVPAVSTYIATLQGNRYYCWQVVARNAYGETHGPVWDFGTAGALDFELSTTNLDFGGVLTNGPAALRTLIISNNGLRTLTLDLSVTNPAFGVRRVGEGMPTNFTSSLNYQIFRGEYSTVEVRFAPATVGLITDLMTLRTVDACCEHFTNWVALTGTGLASAAGTPSNPSPPNGATGQSTETDLGWQNGAGTTAVDLLFGKVGQPMAYLLSNAPPTTHFDLSRLNYNSTYQWQVVCRGGGGETPGPVWTFATGVPLMEVVSPNGGERWRAGTAHPIQWKYKGDADTVRLDLYKLDLVGRRVFVSTLASNVPSDSGTFTWNIDPRLEPGDGYFIRVRDGNELNYSDYNDAPFTITPTIVVTYPNGGEQVRAGAPCTITWLGAGLGGQVGLELWQNGEPWRRLAEAPNTGAYAWNVPCELEGRGFQVNVIWREDESLNDQSDGYFDVVILPPDAASHPSPADGGRDVSLTPMLAWTNGAGTCTVDLLIGRDDPPGEMVLSNVATNRFQLEKLKPERRLFWRVVSRNAAGTTPGPVWSFTTMAELQPPRLALPARNGNHLEFLWTPHQTGVQYHFQSTTNLSVGFTDLAVLQTNRFTHTNGATLPARFYRVVAQPAP